MNGEGDGGEAALTLEPADLELLHAESYRIERRRRLGVLMMYSPVFFLFLNFGVMLTAVSSFARPGSGQQQGMPDWVLLLTFPLILGLLVSMPLAIVGVVIRAVAALRLARFDEEWAGIDYPAYPPIKHGEQVGLWRIDTAQGEIGGGVRISSRVVHPILWYLMEFAAGLMVTAMVTMVFYSSSFGSSLGAGAVTFIWSAVLLSLFASTTVRISTGQPEPTLTVVRRYPLYLHVLGRRTLVRASDIRCITASETQITIERATGASIGIPHLSPGSLGAWQAKRLAGFIAERMGLVCHCGDERLHIT